MDARKKRNYECKYSINKDESLKRSEENVKAAYQLIRKKVTCKKLSWLDQTIQDNPNYEHKAAIAMYIYFNKSDKVSKMKYPNLFRVMNEFEESVQRAIDDDPYFEIFKIYELRRNKHSAKKFISEARSHINRMIEEEGISINQIADYTGIKYANLYNFLVKEEDGKIKLEKVHKTLWLLWGMREGVPIEEALKIHKEKIKRLWEHWKVDIE